MRSDEIEARLEALRIEDAAIWAGIDVGEIAAQMRGKPLGEATAQRIAESNLIKERIRCLELALETVVGAEARASSVGDAEVKRRRESYPLH